MRINSTKFKRVQAMVLALAMMLTSFTFALDFGVSALDDPQFGKTEGEIVAENYDLTEAEKKLLESGFLVGSTISYNKPDNDSNLISVDIENKTITAASYEGWVPVSCDIVVGDDVKESALTIANNQVTYTYDGDVFSVKVYYEYTEVVDEDIQNALLTGPAALKEGLSYLEAIKTAEEYLALVSNGDVIDVLGQMGTESGYKFTFGYPDSPIFTVRFHTEEGKTAAVALRQQTISNPSENFDISKLISGYISADSKVQFLVENSAEAYAKLVETYGYINSLLNDKQPGDVQSTNLEILANYATIFEPSLATPFNALIKGMKDWVAAVEPLIADTWAINETEVVKEGLTPVQYQALDTMVAALGGTLNGESVAIKNPLLVDSTILQFNMSMSNVTVKVVLNVVDDANNVVTYSTKTTTITLADGATKAELLAEIAEKNLVANAIAAWGNAYVEGQYTAAYSTLPETIDEDIVYTITYSPNTYTVTSNYAEDIVLPYGYNLTLPLHSNGLKSYDYFIGGNYCAQGSIYEITGDIAIERKEGKAYTSSTLNKVVSDNLFANDSKAQAILNSGAILVGNDVLNVRYPDEADGIVTLKGTKLTAVAYPSSYEGLDWIPYTYTVNGNVYYFNGDNEAVIEEANFDSVSVSYRLKLTNLADADVLKIANLPAELVADAKDQLEVLNRLNSKYSEMEGINKSTFGAANGMIDVQDSDTISDEVKAAMKAAISGVINNCCGSDGKLVIYGMLTTYRDANNGGLKYYYTNSAKFISEVDKLAGYLSDLLETEEQKAALAVVLNAAGFGSYTDRIEDLNSLMAEIKADLKAPDERIDLTSDKLGALCKALTSTGTPATFTEIDALALNKTITVAAEGKVTISSNVAVVGGNPIEIAPIIFNSDHIFTVEDVESIISAIDAAIAQLNVSVKYYETNYDVRVIEALVGQNVSELDVTKFEFTWTAKEFTVKVEGADDQVVTNESLTIRLPAAPEGEGVRYDYVIGGNTYPSGEYNFTLEELDELLVDGEIVIERVEVDIARYELIEYVNSLNAAIGNDDVVFVLTESANGYAIVLQMNVAETDAMMGAVQNLATALATGRYTYIAFDKDAFIFTENDSTKISIQALINTLMTSGFGTNTLVNMMDANGNINHIAMPGEVISDKDVNAAGGKLAETRFVIGDSADSISYNIPMYITLGSVSSDFVQLRNLIANQLSQYFVFTCVNGKANIALNMPQKAYEAYLAVLLATDNVDITDINAVNNSVAAGFLLDVIYPLMNSDASITSVQNTLAKFGFNINLEGYDAAFESIRNFYKNHYPANADSANKISVKIGISQYLTSLGDMAGMIVEKDTGISISAEASIINLARDYEAIFFDIGAEGLLNKFGLVDNVAAKLADMKGTSVVILLKDINKDLTFNTTTLLNLNGCVVNGDLTGKGSVKIVDSAIDSAEISGVTGKISGKVSITGGTYSFDVSNFLPEGYAQFEDGEVRNEFVNVIRDEDGNITVTLNAGVLATRVLPDVKSLAADIFVELLLNGYTANKLDFEGYKVFEITVDDLVGIYTSKDKLNAVVDRVLEMVDPGDLVEIMKILVDDFCDFDSFKATLDSDIANGVETPLLSYDITTGVWGLETTYIEEDDSISIDVTSKHITDRKLDIVITGSVEDKQHLANLVGILADTTDIEISYDKIQGGNQSGTIVFDVALGIDVKVDFASDPKYAVMLSVIVADGLGSAKNAKLVEGLKYYFENGDVSILAGAFNNLTVAQVIDAIKSFNRGDTFSAMVARLGLDGYDVKDAEELELLIDDYAKVVAALIRKLDIDGTSNKLSGYLGADGVALEVHKANIKREKTINLVSGYKLSVSAELIHFDLYINIFGIEGGFLEPDFGEDNGNPQFTINDKFLGYEVVEDEDGYVRFVLDIDVNGVTKEEFKAALSFTIANAENVTIDIVCDGNYVCNGAKVIVTARNGNQTETMEFIVIILGDIFGDGFINEEDVNYLADALAKADGLEGSDDLAADVTGDGETDVLDLAYVIGKIKNDVKFPM